MTDIIPFPPPIRIAENIDQLRQGLFREKSLKELREDGAWKFAEGWREWNELERYFRFRFQFGSREGERGKEEEKGEVRVEEEERRIYKDPLHIPTLFKLILSSLFSSSPQTSPTRERGRGIGLFALVAGTFCIGVGVGVGCVKILTKVGFVAF
jgi:hypothetical protein